MILDIPDNYWQNLQEEIDATDYCYLCDCHPSRGHAADCPLREQNGDDTKEPSS